MFQTGAAAQAKAIRRLPSELSIPVPFAMESGGRHPDTCPATSGKSSTEDDGVRRVPLPRGHVRKPESDSSKPLTGFQGKSWSSQPCTSALKS